MAEHRPRPVLIDPVLLWMAGLALATVPWFLIGPGGNTSSWVVQTGLDMMIVVMAWRLARISTSTRPARRFYRALVITGLCCAAGDLFQTVHVLRNPTDTRISLVQSILVVTGMLVAVVTMLCHPIGSTGRPRLRLWLDAATALAAVAVFLWYFVVAAPLADSQVAGRYVAAAVSAVMLVIAFGVLKLLLSGTAPFTMSAGLLAGVGVTGTAVGAPISTMITGGTNPGISFVAQLLPCILVVAALRLQATQMRRRPAGTAEEHEQRFTRLPYLAVVGTQTLLVVALLNAGLGARVWGVLAGGVVITGLVLTRQMLAFHDNNSQKEWFRSLVQHASDVSLVVDADQIIGYASPAAYRVLGIDPGQATGLVLTDRVHPDDRPVFAELADRLAAAPGAGANTQVRLRHTDGTYRWLDVVGTDLRAKRDVRGIVYNARDITEARQLQEELRHRATHDGLTGLANRGLLGDRLAELPGDRPAGVLVLDLDGFKQINDRYGHHAGDELLIAVAARLTALLAAGDIAARLGGDEFAVLLADAGGSRAQEMASRVEAALSEPLVVGGERLRVGVSVGAATGSPRDAAGLLREADAAMYVMKHSLARR